MPGTKPPTPTRFWRLDELQENARVDHFGGPDFEENGACASSATALFGRSADMTAKTSYLRCGDNDELHPAGTFTWAVWIQFVDANHQQAYLVAKRDAAGDAADRFWFIDHLDTINDPARFRFILRNAAGDADQTVEFAHVPTNGVWNLVIASYDADAQTVGLSVNGSGFTTAAAADGSRGGEAGTIPTSLAKEGDAATTSISGRGNQRMDHLMFWDGVALTNANAAFLWNNGLGPEFPFAGGSIDGSLRAGGESRLIHLPFLNIP
jgi:hypothetical protein